MKIFWVNPRADWIWVERCVTNVGVRNFAFVTLQISLSIFTFCILSVFRDPLSSGDNRVSCRRVAIRSCVASFGLIFFACWESGSMRIDILPPCSIFPSRACYCDSRSPFHIERILSVKMSSYGCKNCQKFVKSIQKVWCRPPANVWNKKKQYIVIFSSKLIVEAYENREQRNSRQHAIVAILIKSLMWIISELQMSTCLFLHDKGSNLNIFTNKYWIIRN